jgi:hypothetical protein
MIIAHNDNTVFVFVDFEYTIVDVLLCFVLFEMNIIDEIQLFFQIFVE